MTRKSTLRAWASCLGTNPPANATVAELEQSIEGAIANLTNPSEPGPTLGEALRNNWAVVKAEAIPTVTAIAANLRS